MLEPAAENYLAHYQQTFIAIGISEAARSHETRSPGFLQKLAEAIHNLPEASQNQDEIAAFLRGTVFPLVYSHTFNLDNEKLFEQIAQYIEEDIQKGGLQCFSPS